MSQIEREIKILNVDVSKVKAILEKKGITPKWQFIQDVYTYDLPTIDELYIRYLNSFLTANDKRGLEKLIREIRPCFDKEDLKLIENILGTKDILEFINNSQNDYNKLNSDNLLKLMNKTNDNFSKWIRLRQIGDETTITIKKIVNSKGEYELDAVDELEIAVPSIADGKQLLGDLGCFFARHQTKMRIAYDYGNTEIVIDKWPRLAPYIEIEGATKEDIDEAVLMLGYNIEDEVIINTDGVYKQIDIDIYADSYRDLFFDEEEIKEVESYMK